MTPTAAGEILLSRVEGMMREFDRVKSHVAALQNLQSGTVDVYCFQAAIEGFITPVLHEFHPRYPNVSFNITVSSTDETMVALTNRTAEIELGAQSAGSRRDCEHRIFSRHDRSRRSPQSSFGRAQKCRVGRAR